MALSLHFAHVTDPHISESGDSWATLGALGPRLLKDCFARLNQIDDLDFVLITGDVLDQATPLELEWFIDALAALRKPWHFVPGNHDGFYHEANPRAFRPAEAVAVIDPRMASPAPEANQAYWSRPVAPGVQLIGLDSRIATDWAGTISAGQLDWLRRELDAHDSDRVLIALHHPLHYLGPHNEREWFDKFIVSNGPVVERLLDQYPGVVMVIAGHHHANQIALRRGRLHLNTASLTGYPCVYRTVRLTGTPDGLQVHIETHPAADPATVEEALAVLKESEPAQTFEPGSPMAWAEFCAGRDIDWEFDGLLLDAARRR